MEFNIHNHNYRVEQFNSPNFLEFCDTEKATEW